MKNQYKYNLDHIEYQISDKKDIPQYFDQDKLVYSFILFYNDENKLYTLKIKISDNPKYNTINLKYYQQRVIEVLNVHTNSKCVCFEQPPLEILTELYRPLVASLASSYSTASYHYEYDDVYQDCYYCICYLYNKGYFLNKGIISKTLYNYLYNYASLVNKHGDEYLSINDLNDDDCTIDCPDLDDVYKQQDEEESFARLMMFSEIKSAIVEQFGERRYEQLLRSYSSGTTDSGTRRLLMQVKSKLDQMGLTRDYLYKKYFGG